jgi:hypothetical protein
MICRQLLKKKTEVLQACKFFTVTADEVTTIDNILHTRFSALLYDGNIGAHRRWGNKQQPIKSHHECSDFID